jgi:Tol biopolymer transport system component
MLIEPGTQLLHYTLSEKIGEGGMGAVWKATDTTLNREVAVKLLPQVFANDADRLARFEREAKLLASLNHPNIAGIFGLHEATTDEGKARFLAMEYVEGEDLSYRLKSGPLPLDQALEIAAQMCAGIEAAHENGVVHRDLKPANVIVAPDGRVRLLDFGLAKAFENSPDGSDPSLSPTMTSAGTVAGMILGTAAYMSPEQARGKPVDRRADLWSFGCVLYEMLTGVSLFAGETISDSLAAILRKEPDWSSLPKDTPPMIRLLLRRCLTRDPNKRLRDAGDARLELEQAIDDPSPEALGLSIGSGTSETHVVETSPAKVWLPWAIAALAVIALGVMALGGGDAAAPAPDISHRLVIPVPGPTQYGNDFTAPPTISPDGRLVVFGARDDNGQQQLWLRPFDAFEARPLDGTKGAQFAFWSPDGKHLGFFLAGRLRRIEVATGRVQPIGGVGSTYPRGASWGPDGTIVFAPNANAGIHAIDAAGGPSRQITTPDPDVPDSSHRWPYFLPDGEHFLFLSWTNDIASQEEHGGVYVGSLSGDEPVRLLPDASSVAYAAPGYLLVVQEDNLIAFPFDATQQKITGEGTVVTSDVLRSRDTGYGAFTVSNDGTLIHARGESDLPAQLNWYDRQGVTTPTPLEPAPFMEVRVSPDETQAVAIIPGASGDGELWMVDLERGVRTRLGGGSWSINNPVWSGSGDRILYISQERGKSDVYTRRADGSGGQEEVLVDQSDKRTYDWSVDGKYLAFWQIGAGAGTPDLWIYSMEDQSSTTLAEGEPSYLDARFSPDAAYVTYASDENGQYEIFAQAREGGARKQVSTGGGTRPHWSRDGREIVYFDLDRRTMAVPVESGPNGLTLGTPSELFKLDGIIAVADVTGNHRRFLIATFADVESEPLHVILNWHAGL